ncbi:MAG: hypothetical protein HIU82_07865 [Proteobacteria bacterium]|nr:hypothetical protein [Pseudomonadota bacterium]
MSSSFPVRLLSTLAFGAGLAVVPMTLAQAASHVKSAVLHGYKTEAEAKAGCAGDAIVWRAHDSKVFHKAGSKYFGKTKRGAFVCEKAAEAKGLHAAKS